MSLPIGIVGLGAYTPERVMTNGEWSRRVDTTEGPHRPGDLVLLTAFGAGFHWGAMLLRF